VAKSSSSGSRDRKAAGDLVFAFVHLAALLAALALAIVALIRGNVPRFGVIMILLVIYYVAILHPAVKKEIARRRCLRR
jgi:ABC-type multidrug transport system permease subunit